VIRRLAQLLLITSLLAGIGGHWVLLQSVAWATMLANNLQSTGVVEAVSNTFDGQHPCSLCLAIQEGRASEKKSDQQATNSTFKVEPGLVWKCALFVMEREREWIATSDTSPVSHRDEPPKPRPRASSAPVIS
jgi:hypothetical protein